MAMYKMLHKKLGIQEKLTAVKVPKKKVAPKKPETVALFGCFGTEVEV